MLLETLDVLHNDVVIYSENKFDFKENFKIIFKRADVKRPQKIDYFEVCKFFRDPTPKNIVVYRLLTSNSEIDAYSTKFGYFIMSEKKLELVYFDPIFALKDLSHLKVNLDSADFRFKVQQVGYTATGAKNNECVYSEVYSFDLRAIEAQNQNDKVFASAIFALDESFIDDDGYSAKTESLDNIAEVQDPGSILPNLSKAEISAAENKHPDVNRSKIEKLKESFASNWESNFKAFSAFKDASTDASSEGGAKGTFSDFLHKEKQMKEEAIKGIFENKDDINFQDRDSVVLRFKE